MSEQKRVIYTKEELAAKVKVPAIVEQDLKRIISDRLEQCGLYYRCFSRIKTASSMAHKFALKDYGAENKKLQDLVGVRINLYFDDDVEICQNIVENTFDVIGWSTSERSEEEFKPTKLNGVCRLPEYLRSEISTETWDMYIDDTFEIQIKTMFFEGWHEIEHEMRYKYKMDEGFDDNRSSLWDGQEKDARMMNSIIANLELCDWSIVQIFDNLARDQYIKKNWENAIRSKYRLKITQDKIKPEVRAYFDEHPEVVEKFWAVSKQQLVNILLNKKYQKVLSPNRVIYLINKEVVNDEFISAQLDREQFGRVLNKEIKQEIRPLVSDLVFDQTIRIRDDGFDRASEIIYEWAYQHISLIFGQMPKKMESVSYEVMGYKLKVVAEKEYFLMDMQTISNEEAGMIWHVVAELRKESDGLYLTCRHICENIYSRERRYNRPKFMRDIFNQVGFLDADVFMDEDTEAVPISADQLKSLLSHAGRSLPVILVDKPEQIPDWAQDFDGYTINAEVLCKSLAGICHVFLGDESCISRMQEIYGNESIDGAVFYWGRDDESPTIFTQEAIRKACFEEVNHSVDEDEEYEKAFRYRLRELVCQEFH